MAAPSQTIPPGQPEAPPYRSYKEFQGEGIHVPFSSAAKRLFWPLESDSPTAISVMRTLRNANDLEPYFQPSADGSGSGTWHEIAQLPLTAQKVSSIEMYVEDLNQWESDWVAWHSPHNQNESVPEGVVYGQQEYVTYGDLSDEDRPYATEQKEDGSWEEDSDADFLVKCCGQDRPLRKRGQKLVITPSAGDDPFVTVHDFVMTVHPWIKSLRGDILEAKTVARFEPFSAPSLKKWMVRVENGPQLEFQEKETWMEGHGVPRGPVTASSIAILNRIRAMRNR